MNHKFFSLVIFIEKRLDSALLTLQRLNIFNNSQKSLNFFNGTMFLV